MNNIAGKEEKIYYDIKKKIKKYKYSPSFRELAKINNCSTSTIQSNINKLKVKGYITYEKGRNRTLTILKEE